MAIMFRTRMAMARWWRTSRPRVGTVSAVREDRAYAGIIMTAGMRARTLDEAPHGRMPARDDTMDLVRTDDDGAWQRPPAQPAGASHRRFGPSHV